MRKKLRLPIHTPTNENHPQLSRKNVHNFVRIGVFSCFKYFWNRKRFVKYKFQNDFLFRFSDGDSSIL